METNYSYRYTIKKRIRGFVAIIEFLQTLRIIFKLLNEVEADMEIECIIKYFIDDKSKVNRANDVVDIIDDDLHLYTTTRRDNVKTIALFNDNAQAWIQEIENYSFPLPDWKPIDEIKSSNGNKKPKPSKQSFLDLVKNRIALF